MKNYLFNNDLIIDSKGQELCNKKIAETISKYIGAGYSKITSQILINEKSEIVILKSVVKTTNKHEIQSISLSDKVFNQIKDKTITIEVFERNCYRSVQIKRYSVKVLKLIDTGTYRCKRSNTKRYNLLTTNDYVNLKTYKITLVS